MHEVRLYYGDYMSGRHPKAGKLCAHLIAISLCPDCLGLRRLRVSCREYVDR
jgi:hypothetical protein